MKYQSKKSDEKNISSSSSTTSSSLSSTSSSSSSSSSRALGEKTKEESSKGKTKEFKEGGKPLRFVTFNGQYGHTEEAMQFNRQFDAAFGTEDYF